MVLFSLSTAAVNISIIIWVNEVEPIAAAPTKYVSAVVEPVVDFFLCLLLDGYSPK